MKPVFTERQGQFLAYIHQYTRVNACTPAEADMQRFFQITPPSVHSMVLTLERRGFIRRVPGQANIPRPSKNNSGRAAVPRCTCATRCAKGSGSTAPASNSSSFAPPSYAPASRSRYPSAKCGSSAPATSGTSSGNGPPSNGIAIHRARKPIRWALPRIIDKDANCCFFG